MSTGSPQVRSPCPKCGEMIQFDPTRNRHCPECGEELVMGADGRLAVRPRRDTEHNPDPNENAARIVRESTGEDQSLPPDLEAAWAEWSKGIQSVDERGWTLLRAAFEAGVEADRRARVMREAKD